MPKKILKLLSNDMQNHLIELFNLFPYLRVFPSKWISNLHFLTIAQHLILTKYLEDLCITACMNSWDPIISLITICISTKTFHFSCTDEIKEQLDKGNFESGLFFDFQRHLTQLIMIFLIKKWITMIYEVQLIIGFLHIFRIELICIINGFFIRTRFIRCCISQASILESSLFLIYKNDLHMQ